MKTRTLARYSIWLGAVSTTVATGLAACGGSGSSSNNPGDSGSDATQDAVNGTDSSSGGEGGSQSDDSSTDGSAEGSPIEAGGDGSTMDAPSEDGAMDAGVIPTCFVPYGCTTYVCVSSDGGSDAGTSASGAVESDGPRAVLVDAGVDAGLGVNEAYTFASGDLMSGTATNLPQGNADRTMMLWANEGANPNGATIFNYGSFVPDERSGILSGAGGAQLYFVGESNDVRGTKVIDDGAWHHLAVTYVGSTRTITLYVDGQLDTASPLLMALDTTGQTWQIGATVTTTTRQPYIGSVSDIRVYDRALTAVEIGEAARFTGAGANPETLRTATGSGLVFWLPLFGSPAVELNRCGP